MLKINPRWPENQKKRVHEAYEKTQEKDHTYILTSGSSGSPKLIALSEEALQASAVSVNEFLQVSEKDVWLASLPDFHVGGLGIHYRARLAGNEVKEFEGWDVQGFIEVLNGVTLTSLVPTQVYDLVEGGYSSPKSLRAVLVGGAALSEDLYCRARELGWPLLPTYGCTEMGSQIATAPLSSLQDSDFPQMKILSHVEVREEEGFLCFKGASLFSGYVDLEDMEFHRQEGWFRSEDRGEVRDGEIKVFGRESDFVKVNGEGVHLGRLQRVLDGLRNGREVYVTARENSRSGSELVFCTSEERAEDLREQFNKIVAPYERVSSIVYVDKIEKSAIGKVIGLGELVKTL